MKNNLKVENDDHDDDRGKCQTHNYVSQSYAQKYSCLPLKKGNNFLELVAFCTEIAVGYSCALRK